MHSCPEDLRAAGHHNNMHLLPVPNVNVMEPLTMLESQTIARKSAEHVATMVHGTQQHLLTRAARPRGDAEWMPGRLSVGHAHLQGAPARGGGHWPRALGPRYGLEPLLELQWHGGGGRRGGRSAPCGGTARCCACCAVARPPRPQQAQRRLGPRRHAARTACTRTAEALAARKRAHAA